MTAEHGDRNAGVAADVVAAWHGHTERVTQAVYRWVADNRLTAASAVRAASSGPILRACGKDPASARIRIQGLFYVVAHDPDKAIDELAPYFLHVNNSYGQWLNEDRASTGMGDATRLKPMTLEEFKASGIFQVLTPAEAIALFNDMRAKAPVEHFTMMLPPGLPPAQFKPYAEVFAQEVIPAFR